MASPILTIDLIPRGMWHDGPDDAGNSAHSLHLPELLVTAYGEVLDELGWRADAKEAVHRDDGPLGGVSEEETRRHFTSSFSGSCARLQLVMLDPKEVYETTRDLFVKLFAGGHLHVLDVPCGAGAGGATLLCLAGELRKAGVLPRHPLEASIVGGDISVPARSLKRRLYRHLAPKLAECGIVSKVRMYDWDIEDAEQTSSLIARWVEERPKSAEAAVVALNFSGFLAPKVKDCKQQLMEILRYAAVQAANMVWVEPCTNVALDKLFPALRDYVFSKVKRIRPKWNDYPRRAECTVAHPMQLNGAFCARAAAVHLGTAEGAV